MNPFTPPESTASMEFERKHSVVSTAYSTTSSRCSSDRNIDMQDIGVITPQSEFDDSPRQHFDDRCDSPQIAPKIEEDEEYTPGLDGVNDEVKPTLATGPRKRGRPRKHPVVEHKKTSHARSKTGCGTCRRRKKKCDETKPSCINCEKNNVVCDGYVEKQPWRSGKLKSLTRRGSQPLPGLPSLISGVETSTDSNLLVYFESRLCNYLSLADSLNPFHEIVLPMALHHKGVMHSLLYLSASCMVASADAFDEAMMERQQYHSSKAMTLLAEDLQAHQLTVANNAGAPVSVGEPLMAQTLLLCLQSICAGDTGGQYRPHLNGLKDMLSVTPQPSAGNSIRPFVTEFLLYHEYLGSITSLVNPLDQRSMSLMEELKDSVDTNESFFGCLAGLFGLIARIRLVRDHIWAKRINGKFNSDGSTWIEAFAIDDALKRWECNYIVDSPRYIASLLYRQCTFIYLHRTIMPSAPCPQISLAVDKGLEYLRMVPWDGPDIDSIKPILIMPLFLLGCAAFKPEQRPEIAQAFQRLQDWSSLGNIRCAREVVEAVWARMDNGMVEETWHWESIMAEKGWDFLVT